MSIVSSECVAHLSIPNVYNTDKVDSIEIAVQAGTSFVQLYYAAYDASNRAEDVPKFYRTHSAISWNGNPIQGPEGLSDLLKKLPATVHNVQSFDCHPVPSEYMPIGWGLVVKAPANY